MRRAPWIAAAILFPALTGCATLADFFSGGRLSRAQGSAVSTAAGSPNERVHAQAMDAERELQRMH